MAGEANLAAEADQHVSGHIRVIGEPGEDALELPVVGPLELEAASPLVGDGEDAVEVRIISPPGAVPEPIGDVLRDAGRAVHRADDREIVPRADPAIGPEDAGEGAEAVGDGRLGTLGGEGVVALEQVGPDVLDVDPGPGGDIRRGEADNLAVLEHGLALRDVDHGELVPRPDRLPSLDLQAVDGHGGPLGNPPSRDRHIVARSQPDRSRCRIADRRRHAEPSLPFAFGNRP
jgi:hypothetical protein